MANWTSEPHPFQRSYPPLKIGGSIVRIGANSYKVSHHKLKQRSLSTTVRLPPIDPRVSEFVYGPETTGASNPTKRVEKRLPTVANTIDFADHLPSRKITEIATRAKKEIVFRWDFETDRSRPKPTWSYLTRQALSHAKTAGKPLPSINNSINRAALHGRKESKLGANLARFSGDLLTEGKLDAFHVWHEQMKSLGDAVAPPNSVDLSHPVTENATSSEPLVWRRKGPRSDSTTTTSNSDREEFERDHDSCNANDVHSLFTIQKDSPKKDKMRPNLIAIHVPESDDNDFDGVSSPIDKHEMVERWLEDNFNELVANLSSAENLESESNAE